MFGKLMGFRIYASLPDASELLFEFVWKSSTPKFASLSCSLFNPIQLPF